jgi:signal transduction histidine kinase
MRETRYASARQRRILRLVSGNGSLGRTRAREAAWPAVVAAWTITCVGAVTTLVLGWDLLTGIQGSTVGAELPGALSVVAVVGVAPILAGVWLLRSARPSASIGLAIAALGALLPLWGAWGWLSPSLRAVTLAVAPLAVVGVARLAIGAVDARDGFGRRATRLVSVLVAVAVAIHVVGYDPFTDPGCVVTCRRTSPVLGGSAASTRWVVAATSLLTVVAAGIAGLVATRRPRPRRSAPIATTATAALAGLAVLAAIRWLGYGNRSIMASLLVLTPVVVGAVGAAGVLVAARTARVRLAVDRLVASLSDAGGGTSTLGKGIVGAAFAVPGEPRWLDAVGVPAPAPSPGHRTILLSHSANPAVRLEVDARADESEVLAALTPETQLALRNAYLSAVVAAGLTEVRASQRRVVATADAERRRIERDLHDGAQQRLVTAAFHLKVALNHAGPEAVEALQAAETLVGDSLRRLRELARGLHPRTLTDEGLVVALEELAAASDVPTTLEIWSNPLLPPDVEMAIYTVVESLLGDLRGPTAGTRVHIRLLPEGSVVKLFFDLHRGDAGGGTFPTTSTSTDLDDRVGAVGGRLSVDRHGQGDLRLTAELPCES